MYNLDGTEIKPLGSVAHVNSVKNTSVYAFDVFNKYARQFNYAYDKTGASSSSKGGNTVEKAFDGKSDSRWESNYNDNQWIAVDLGIVKPVSAVVIKWEGAFGKSYKIQVSTNGNDWNEVFTTDSGDGNIDEIDFTQVNARYVRMQGIKRGTVFGYSIYELEVYGSDRINLTDVHFLKLQLKDSTGKVVSDNFYWTGKSGDYTLLNTLKPVNLKVQTQVSKQSEKFQISSTIENPLNSAGIAFTVRVQVVSAATGKRILPVYMNDNYFSLLKGEIKNFTAEFDASLIAQGDSPKLLIEQYAEGNEMINQPTSSRKSKMHGGIKLKSFPPYPNPFSNEITIQVNAKEQANVQVKIYNSLGQTQYRMQQVVPAGDHNFVWDGKNFSGKKVQPGNYTIALFNNEIKTGSYQVIKSN